MRNLTKRGILYIAVFLLLSLLLAVYLMSGRPHVSGLFRDGAYGTVLELDSSFNYAVQKYNGGVAVFGKEGVWGITNSGQKAWSVDFPCTDPILSAGGRYVLAAERGGQKLKLIAGRKVTQEMTTDDEIITASVNKKGTFAVVTKERGYKGRVNVLSASGKQLFAWHSAEQNILAVAVSEDNTKLAVSVVNMQDPSKVCTVYQFDLKETSPKSLAVGNENLISNLIYNGNELVAVGDEALYCFKADGAESFKIDYKGRELQKFSFYSGGVLAMGFRDGGSGASVCFYDMHGREKGSHFISGEIFALAE